MMTDRVEVDVQLAVLPVQLNSLQVCDPRQPARLLLIKAVTAQRVHLRHRHVGACRACSARVTARNESKYICIFP